MRSVFNLGEIYPANQHPKHKICLLAIWIFSASRRKQHIKRYFNKTLVLLKSNNLFFLFKRTEETADWKENLNISFPSSFPVSFFFPSLLQCAERFLSSAWHQTLCGEFQASEGRLQLNAFNIYCISTLNTSLSVYVCVLMSLGIPHYQFILLWIWG